MQTLVPTAVRLSNLSGAVGDLDESPDSPDANWCTGSVVALTGLIFPSNDIEAGDTVQLRLSGANLPDIVPLTLLWKVYPIQQTGYYTTFFHGQADGDFGAVDYFGCHPYPQGGPSGTAHNWEISIEGVDDITDENSNDTTVTKGQWYSQAASSRANGGASTIIDFYWDLGTSSNRRISHTTSYALDNADSSPAITFGDAPWSPGNECLNGRLRGIQIYNSQLSQADIEALHVCETDAQVLAVCTSRSITSLWYLNMNPTPDDVTDKSGEGHNPAWVNANRPTLWEG